MAFPVPLHSEVSFTACEGCEQCDATLAALGPLQRRAVGLYADGRGTSLPVGHWRHTSQLPVGRGMSSSTADIVAAVRCAAACLGRTVGSRELQDIMRRLERSDPVHLDHPVVYLSARQRVVREFPATDLVLNVVYAYRGALDTADVEERDLLDHYALHEVQYAATYKALCTALALGDAVTVAGAATESARLGQGHRHDPLVEALLATYREIGAAGVVRAHSGTAAGLLFAGPPPPKYRADARTLLRHLGVEPHETTGGFGRVPARC